MPYDFKDIASANAYAEAEAAGCVVKIPSPNELFIDIDDKDSAMWFCLNVGKINEQVGVKDTHRAPSPSGKPEHEHIVLTLVRDVTDMERIAMQSFLGSDRKREALSWVRLVNNDPNPTLFYEKKPLELAEAIQKEGIDDRPF
jgi:hypothetical protein